MSLINYQIQPLNNTVTPGQPIGANNEFTSIIAPLDPSEYYVNYTMFNVSGATPTETGSNFRTFYNGDSGVILPPYVEKVKFEDPTSGFYDGETIMKVTVNPVWIVPINSVSPFQIVIDIDGDAQLISTDSSSDSDSDSTTIVNQFNITVSLTASVPNAKVFSVIPGGTNSYTDEFPASWTLTPVDSFFPSQASTSNSASVLCTYSGSAQASARLMWNGTNLHNQAWFWIVPDQGYTVSRHNFSIENSSISASTNPITGDIGATYYTASYVPQWAAGANLSSFAEANVISNLDEGNYAYVGWGAQTTDYNVFYEIGATSINATAMINNLNAVAYGTSQVLLIDKLGGPYSDYDSVPYPYNLDGTDFTAGQPPTNYVALDWSSNAVLIALNVIQSYIPGETPEDVVLKLSGEAMLIDNATSNEFNINIEDE